MGYITHHKGFVCYDSSTRKLHISRNVVFFENQYFFPHCDQSSPDIVVVFYEKFHSTLIQFQFVKPEKIQFYEKG